MTQLVRRTLSLALLVGILVMSMASTAIAGTYRSGGDRPLYSMIIQGDGTTGTNLGVYSTSFCGTIFEELELAGGDHGSCGSNFRWQSWSTDVRITKICMTPDLSMTGADGVTFRIANQAGDTLMGDLEASLPLVDATHAAFLPACTDTNTVIPAGTRVTHQFKDGFFCQSGGGACDFGASFGAMMLEYFGEYL